MHGFHTWLVWIITAITLFVLALLIYVVVQVQRAGEPGRRPRTTHNTLLEVAWTMVPVLILVVIAIPSFRLLRKQLDHPEGRHDREGHRAIQWYWSYEYPADQGGGFSFDANMLDEAKDREAPASRACSPSTTRWSCRSNKVVRVQVTGAGRDPLLRHAVLRHQDRRRSRAA